MRFSLVLSATVLATTSAFTPLATRPTTIKKFASSFSSSTPSALQMSTESVEYVITGNNIDVTQALNDYVSAKLDKIVGKISSNAISECDVHLTVNKNPKVSYGVMLCLVVLWYVDEL